LKTKKNRSAGFENQEKLLDKPAKQIATVSFLGKLDFSVFMKTARFPSVFSILAHHIFSLSHSC
jgi:hypothetical protein